MLSYEPWPLHIKRRCSDTDNDSDRCSVAVWSLESCHTDRSPATNDAGNQGKYRTVQEESRAQRWRTDSVSYEATLIVNQLILLLCKWNRQQLPALTVSAPAIKQSTAVTSLLCSALQPAALTVSAGKLTAGDVTDIGMKCVVFKGHLSPRKSRVSHGSGASVLCSALLRADKVMQCAGAEPLTFPAPAHCSTILCPQEGRAKYACAGAVAEDQKRMSWKENGRRRSRPETPIRPDQQRDRPWDWRIANVVPIFKKGSKSEPGNYRPRRCSDTDNDPDRCSVAVWSLESCHTDSSPATNDPEVPVTRVKHRVTKRRAALSNPMFTLVTSVKKQTVHTYIQLSVPCRLVPALTAGRKVKVKAQRPLLMHPMILFALAAAAWQLAAPVYQIKGISKLTMCMAPAHQEDCRFLVLHNLHDAVVLGFPWLQMHNPDVFDEPKSSSLPPHRDCDCAIDLIPG
ncbi:unnamed protein product [Ranitomeya imitator]|uniref:Uncharacterized protein n=1 Tax=Ranitomeya imitator TaxID=111125 RepID=A0ABN9KPJ4_9NEOB|nr:unnamed protein product [Ranitomeya imitator]